jgi:hypothetical protein
VDELKRGKEVAIKAYIICAEEPVRVLIPSGRVRTKEAAVAVSVMAKRESRLVGRRADIAARGDASGMVNGGVSLEDLLRRASRSSGKDCGGNEVGHCSQDQEENNGESEARHCWSSCEKECRSRL